MSRVKFVHWTAWMPSSDKLCNNFRAAGTNECLHFSLSLLAASDSIYWPCRMLSGSKKLRLAKENVAPWRRSSTGWIPERTGRLSVGVGRRYLVAMRIVSSRTLSIKRVYALRHQAGAQHSAVQQLHQSKQFVR